ncbi:hypothetical protein A3770_06p44800 [Chloropicon primus]|uniref:MD-2-related lipid-recognition domain-containing protein n=1 Tax=Chloropicon primus TaxID=1764295 RepID=A0A5B8MRR3_9CHLO|nr:hypothetical protein A3770_06p44800 [Chloropicon primus]|eukprot:QDZ21962.1 hypothetical protein A3770_06p44800 [Chloropicon primus]
MTRVAKTWARVLVLALGFLVAAQAQAAKWKYCDGEWEARIMNATVVPDPARAGQEINVLIDGEIGRLVKGGELDLTVLFHRIPVYKEKDDLCDRLESCPANGAFTVNAKQKLPPLTLPGNYQLKITAKDTEDKDLVCMVLDLEIKGPAIF